MEVRPDAVPRLPNHTRSDLKKYFELVEKAKRLRRPLPDGMAGLQGCQHDTRHQGMCQYAKQTWEPHNAIAKLMTDWQSNPPPWILARWCVFENLPGVDSSTTCIYGPERPSELSHLTGYEASQRPEYEKIQLHTAEAHSLQMKENHYKCSTVQALC